MCISLIAHKIHPQYKLILAFNRDEDHKRPTKPLGFWLDNPSILAGKDFLARGTWLGVSITGRIANITNYRDARIPRKKDPPSRGQIVRQYLEGNEKPKDFLKSLKTRADQFNGFSLVVGDGVNLYFYSNIENKIKRLSPGIYGLSNLLLDSPWPKVETGKKNFADLISKNSFSDEDFFDLLSDKTIAERSSLPDTGYGSEFERMASPWFINNSQCGTRSSSVILIDYQHNVFFTEKTFDQNAKMKTSISMNFKLKITEKEFVSD